LLWHKHEGSIKDGIKMRKGIDPGEDMLRLPCSVFKSTCLGALRTLPYTNVHIGSKTQEK